MEITQDSTLRAWPDSTCSARSDDTIQSNDPSVAGLPDTPKTVVCEFCGAERYTNGFVIGKRILWCPGGANPCECPEGQAKHKRQEAERAADKEADKKAEEDRKLRERVERITGDSGLGARFLQRTFENFRIETTEQQKIIASAMRYAEQFDQKLPKRGEPIPGRNGLLIIGPQGTGKTHVCAAIANFLLNKGTAVICMTERQHQCIATGYSRRRP